MGKSVCCYCGIMFERRSQQGKMIIHENKKYHTKCLNSYQRVRAYLSESQANDNFVFNPYLEAILINLTHLDYDFNE